MDTLTESRSLNVSPLNDRFRLISLGEIVHRIDSKLLAELTEQPNNIYMMPRLDFSYMGSLDQTQIDLYKAMLLQPMTIAAQLGLRYTAEKYVLVMGMLEKGFYPVSTFKNDMLELIRLAKRELDDHFYLELDQNKLPFLNSWRDGWEEVMAKFPSTVTFNDVEEASKCIAFERHTASVFHLMRIMEVGLRTLGATLNDPNLDPRRNPSWNNILSKCRAELDEPLNKRSAEWKADDVFFSGATAHLMAVKDAWRNPTMHVETVYTEESAVDVFNHVKSFMRHLATKLQEMP